MAYVYNADIYCDDCGQLIIDDLNKEGLDDEGDSDGYPQPCDDDAESDSPQHCGNLNCVNAVTLPDGSKIGCLIGTNLTAVGVEYVKQAVKEGGLVAEFWREQFDFIDFPPDYEKELKAHNLTRVDLVEWLESADIQCYDYETYETLYQAVLSNLEDGTLSLDDIP
jgi:hypothetical protein